MNRTLLHSVAGLVVCLAMSSTARESGSQLQRLVLDQQRQKVHLGVQDVYKLLFQSRLGNGHMIADSLSAARYLEQELATCDTTIPGESLVEPISVDGAIIRVNLRPFRRGGISPDLLVRAMLASERTWRPDTAGLRRDWAEFVGLCRDGSLRFPPEEVERWDAFVRKGKVAPVHHSEAYTKANRPAYRVVRRILWEDALDENTR